MKWFKHDTDCSDSEGLNYLLEIEGFAGYGRWFRLLEIVARKMDNTNRCYIEYSANKWASLLGLKQKKLKTFLELSENKLKTKVVYSDNIIRIEIPNLLNKRDEYTKKSRQAPDNVLPKKEEERKKNKEERKEEGEKKVLHEAKPASQEKNKLKISDEEWLGSLRRNKAYEGLDIEVIHGKMLAWCELKGKKPTRARLLGWLNREERPLTGNAPKPTTSAGIAMEYLRKKAKQEEKNNVQTGNGEIIDISIAGISESKDLAK